MEQRMLTQARAATAHDWRASKPRTRSAPT
jgi:hypothetical protein